MMIDHTKSYMTLKNGRTLHHVQSNNIKMETFESESRQKGLYPKDNKQGTPGCVKYIDRYIYPMDYSVPF